MNIYRFIPKTIIYFLRRILILCWSINILYWGHRSLRMQYFNRCNRDLFRILLFDGTICSFVQRILSIVETFCDQVFKHYMFYAIGIATATAAYSVTTFKAKNNNCAF